MQTMTIQQAIFMTSTLRQKLTREIERFDTEYRMPIAINNKSIVTDEKSDAVHTSLTRINHLKQDIVTLKTAIHHANCQYTIEIDGHNISMSALLEQLKLDRSIIRGLQNNISYGYGKERMKTVAGVGVVEEGIIEEQHIIQYIEQLETAANDKSMLVDQINSTQTIEVTLLSE